MKKEIRATGLLMAAAAYFSWGILPLYWRVLARFESLTILAHRIVWSVPLLFLYMKFLRNTDLQKLDKRSALSFALSALLIGSNWYVYIHAIETGRLLEASLGYFINPLLNVLLAAIFFKERLTRPQMVSCLFAFLGVALLAQSLHSVPWIGLFLAGSFSLYGIIRKTARFGALTGLYAEMLYLMPLALVYLLFFAPQVAHPFSTLEIIFLGCAGLVTALPLFWFASAARTLPLAALGFLQYLSPTLQFLIAVLVFGEDFSVHKLLSFVFIWIGLGVFTAELLRRRASGATALR